MNLLIKSAKIIDRQSPFHLKTQDVLIENGKITEISSTIKNTNNIKEIELENLHISAGWFDTSVSFGEPGFEERENLANGLSVAAKSGFTAVAVNPNTYPVIDNKSAVEFLINKAKGNIVNLYPIANLTQQANGQEIAELFDMSNSGAIAFSDYNKSISNANLMKIALLYAQNFDGLVMSFPQNNSLSNNGVANEGAMSTKLGLKGIPTLAEELQIARDLFLLEYTGGKLHIPTISTEKSVKLIAEAKKKGLNITCSVSAHHLFLTDSELHEFDTIYKVKPPLRENKDVNALKKGIANGTIDMITSDHNPIDIENKKVEFENAKNGTIGMESFFGAINKVLPLEKAIDCITNSPRMRFNIENPTIAKGEMANITLFNPDAEYKFSKENIFSTSKNSAFIGKQLKGKVYGIFANNKFVIN
ncbi:dihydroorotase [Aureibaculum sp. A20]|uniref:Dihydroorotase n=1 Tax=Aureibaculum flavum TaxID=2795986 RepID=A0ABS0WLK4_9FLAO|nr:dihydroorotase [Aureibaculum flavum]MBJ2172851.1 dihydroorotase [Aureibaculum flavum]